MQTFQNVTMIKIAQNSAGQRLDNFCSKPSRESLNQGFTVDSKKEIGKQAEQLLQ